MSSRSKIQTGDRQLDEALEHEAVLKSRMADVLAESGLPTVAAFLWPWLDGAAISSATWRFGRLVGLPDNEMDDEAPPLARAVDSGARPAGRRSRVVW